MNFSQVKKPNDISWYEHFIQICGKHGMDTEQLRNDLEYQILTDYALSNRDRHMNNIGILRNAETLQFERLAPIFDTGKCLFVNDNIPLTEKEFLSLHVNSFATTEDKLLSYVMDASLVDTDTLPSPSFIAEKYKMDTQMPQKRIEMVCNAYENKLILLLQFQNHHRKNYDMHRKEQEL